MPRATRAINHSCAVRCELTRRGARGFLWSPTLGFVASVVVWNGSLYHHRAVGPVSSEAYARVLTYRYLTERSSVMRFLLRLARPGVLRLGGCARRVVSKPAMREIDANGSPALGSADEPCAGELGGAN